MATSDRANTAASARLAVIRDAVLALDSATKAAAGAALFGGLVALWAGLRAGSFWLDEVIAVTHANAGVLRFPFEILRNDLHPPLYFLQLMIWDFGGFGDEWVRLNTIFWLGLTVWGVWSVAGRYGGRPASIAAVALYLSFPATAHAAGDLRMYTMVPALLCAFWLVQDGLWAETRLDLRKAAATAAIAAALILVHAIAFYFVALFLSAAWLQAMRERKADFNAMFASLPNVLLVGGVAALAAFPVVAPALLRGSDAYAPQNFLETFAHAGAVIVSWRPPVDHPSRWLGFLVWAGAVALGVRDKRLRWYAVVFAGVSVFLALGVGAFVKPLFKGPVFAAFSGPALAVFFGAAFAKSAAPVRAGFVGLAVVLAVLSFLQERGENPNGPYKDAVAYVEANSQPGDAVFVVKFAPYWGVMRYAKGPRWGDPLKIMNSEVRPEWKSVFSKIPEPTLRAIGWVPEADYIDHDARRWVLGENYAEHGEGRRQFFVLYGRLTPEKTPGPDYVLVETRQFADFFVDRYERRA